MEVPLTCSLSSLASLSLHWSARKHHSFSSNPPVVPAFPALRSVIRKQTTITSTKTFCTNPIIYIRIQHSLTGVWPSQATASTHSGEKPFAFPHYPPTIPQHQPPDAPSFIL